MDRLLKLFQKKNRNLLYLVKGGRARPTQWKIIIVMTREPRMLNAGSLIYYSLIFSKAR